MQALITILIATLLLDGVYSKPFLFNAISAIAEASSSSQSPLSNISDLRHGKMGHLKNESPQHYRQEHRIQHLAPQMINDNNNNNNNNEVASPGIVQRKVARILQKIHYLQSLSRPSTNGGIDSKTKDDDFEKELAEFDEEFNGIDEAATTSRDFGIEIEALRVDERKRSGKQQTIDGNDKVDEDDEDWDVDEEEEEEETILTNGNGGLFNLNQVGVFFMELVASLVGLAYGAAAQFTNNPNQTPPIN